MIVNNAEVRGISVEIDLVDVLGFETVVAACDYNWRKKEEFKWGTQDYQLWIERWYSLVAELVRAGYEWETPETREYRARQGEDK